MSLYRKTVGNVKGEASLAIRSPEDGALAVMMSIIQTAADDIRRHLSPPEPIHPRRSTLARAARQNRYNESQRARSAQSAAKFLDRDAAIAVRILHACGVQVPMRAILSDLQKLKLSTAPSPLP